MPDFIKSNATNDGCLSKTLSDYAGSNPVRFHMPGHKGILSEPKLCGIAPFDVTELSDTDDLCQPEGVLLDIEMRYSSLYDAKACLLSLNGSTAGNIAMLLSIGSGKCVLLNRGCHKSVVSGIALAGHTVVPLNPSKTTGIVDVDSIGHAFDTQRIDAVFITSPNYYGVNADVGRIAEVVHQNGAMLFVDAAHGAHYPFSTLLPNVPVHADAWIEGCHKTLNAFTQASVLCIGKSNPIAVDEMRRMLSLVHTSSPSYPLMLSLENALNGNQCWEAHCRRLIEIRSHLKGIQGVELHDFGYECAAQGAFYDITRLVLSVNGMTGYELGLALESDGIYAEMCDWQYVVLITSPNDPQEWYARLFSSIERIAKNAQTDCLSACTDGLCRSAIGRSAMTVRDAVLSKATRIPLCESVGRIATQAVGIYPPGIATLFPGEIISSDAVAFLLRQAELGANLFGAVGGEIYVVDTMGGF